ncbi:hypothetical protein F5884DRAFT_356174 [Xylogone sp. PMI_703]|nr:hypothetical protein F5884DRAFT_356174 [Xylogone sp. PMI_703]
MSRRGGRGGSGAWGRLKPVNLDPLEAVGLPSKGDKRLLNFKEQEKYYGKIVERYMAFCSSAGRGDELARRFAQLEISNEDAGRNARQSQIVSNSTTLADVDVDSGSQKDLSVLIMAMRKLREGIVASSRIDNFSIQAYIFCIRFAILAKHMESYHPALLHVLRKMHIIKPLSTPDLQELVGYLILDLACRQKDLSQAYAIRHQYQLHDSKINDILRSLSHGNYISFWRAKLGVDGHRARLMEFAEEDMRDQTLKSLGRSYFTIDLPFLEKATGCSWRELIKEHNIGWQLEGSKLTIRKPKAK